MKKIAVILFMLLALPVSGFAQRFSISTNIVDWATLLTYNGELSFALNRHFSIVGGARYNNMQKQGDNHVVVQNRQKTFYAGARYWFWYTNSGAWASAKAQYQDFAQSGIWRLALSESRNVGLGLSGGYSFLLTKWLNIDLGAGFWGGRRLKYTLYDCPVCLNVRDEGPRFFFLPDDIFVCLTFVF